MQENPPISRVRAAWVAKRTSLSVRKVQELAQAGDIPAARLGGVWTFDPQQIERWIQRRETGQDSIAHERDAVASKFATLANRRAPELALGESVNDAYDRLIRRKRAPKAFAPRR